MTTLSRRAASPKAAWQALAVVVLGAIVVAIMASGSFSPVADSSVRDAVPAGFPIPSGAQLAQQGETDSITLDVPGPIENVQAYYRESLPPAGWKVTDTWKGTDPNGLPTTGFIIERGDKPGAIAFTDNDGGRILVRLNLVQPAYSEEMDGMGGP